MVFEAFILGADVFCESVFFFFYPAVNINCRHHGLCATCVAFTLLILLFHEYPWGGGGGLGLGALGVVVGDFGFRGYSRRLFCGACSVHRR